MEDILKIAYQELIRHEEREKKIKQLQEYFDKTKNLPRKAKKKYKKSWRVL